MNLTTQEQIQSVTAFLNDELTKAKNNKNCYHCDNVEQTYAHNYLKVMESIVTNFEAVKRHNSEDKVISTFNYYLKTQHDTKELEILRKNDINKSMHVGVTETYFNVMDKMKFWSK
jgi:hypothetical protein